MSTISPALPLHEYLTLPTAPETWLIEPLIAAGGLCNLFSGPKVGKSYLALDLCRAITSQDPHWLHFTVSTFGNVLYIQLDTPRSLWIDRFKKLRGAGISFAGDPDVDSPYRIYMADPGQVPYPFVLNSDAAVEWLRSQCDAINPVLVVIDTTREAHQGDENDSKQMQAVVSSLVLASRPAACLLISHAKKIQGGKDAPDPSLMDDNRGSGYISGRMDTIIQLRGKEDSPKATMVYQGRAVEHGRVALVRGDNLLWEAPVDAFLVTCQESLAVPYESMRARARKVAELTGESESKCYSALTRLARRLGKISK